LSRQSRRSPNRIYCYTASRSPLAISLSSRATDQQLFSRLQSLHRHPHTKHPQLDSIQRPSHNFSRYVSITRSRFSEQLGPCSVHSHPGPSTPALAISPRHFGHLSKAPSDVHSHRGFPSIPIRSALRAIVPPLRSISRSLAVTPSRTRRRQATSPQQDSQFLYLARSLHRPTIAPLARSPFLRLRALLGFRSHRSWGPLPPPCTTPAPVHSTTSVPRPNSHAPPPLCASSLDR